MNLKQALNPWGYARGLEIGLDIEAANAKSWSKKYNEAVAVASVERGRVRHFASLSADQAQDITTLTSQLEAANGKIDEMMSEFADAKKVIRDLDGDSSRNLKLIAELNERLRIADERADPVPSRCALPGG